MASRFLFLFIIFSSQVLAQGYINQLTAGGIRLSSNTVSTTATNGDLNITPNGSGAVILSNLTASTVVTLDASKKLQSSSVTPTELALLSGLTGAVLTTTSSSTVSNKTIAAGSNTITGLTNTNLSGSAGITGANIATNTVANSNLAQMPANTVKGNNTGSTANALDLTTTQVRALVAKAPTFTTLAGSGTYTVPANVSWIRVRMVGGGSGGSGSGTTISTTGMTAGTNTTFGLHTANGGGLPSSGIQGGAGGSGTIGAGGSGVVFVGGPGGGACGQTSTSAAVSGSGGSSQLGGGGPGTFSANPGVVGQGAGGGGSGGGLGSFTGVTGAGGGAGGTVDIVIAAPAASYSYAVGAGGTGASAGTNGQVAGAGLAGTIVIEENYL